MPDPPHILMLFLDGVGIGRTDPKVNPFFAANMKTLRSLLGGALPDLRNSHLSTNNASLRPINATLRVTGLPQSGTGQTVLLTGMNAAAYIGKHYGPYPYSTLKPILEQKNIFKQLSERGKKVFYANAFPPRYFEWINSPKGRTAVISYSWLASGFKLNTNEVLARGDALSADITGERWNALGFPSVPVLTPQEAGKRLVGFIENYNFVLFEYYLTDKAGHSQSMEKAVDALEQIDSLLEGIVEHMNFKKHLIVLTSDHGNLEDLSTKSHTRNPVPLLVIGSGHKEFTSEVKSLTHVTPSLLQLLQ